MFAFTYTLPNATSVLSDLGLYGSALFDEYLPFVLAIAGILLVGTLLAWIVSTFKTLLHRDD